MTELFIDYFGVALELTCTLGGKDSSSGTSFTVGLLAGGFSLIFISLLKFLLTSVFVFGNRLFLP